MAIQSISNVSFRANEPVKTENKETKVQETSIQTDKKIQDKDDNVKLTGGFGKAVASFFIPGLGQLLDDRKKEGFLFLGSGLALDILGGHYSIKNIQKYTQTGIMPKVTPMARAISLLGLAHTIWRTVDAYRGDKNETKTEKLDKKA